MPPSVEYFSVRHKAEAQTLKKGQRGQQTPQTVTSRLEMKDSVYCEEQYEWQSIITLHVVKQDPLPSSTVTPL